MSSSGRKIEKEARRGVDRVGKEVGRVDDNFNHVFGSPEELARTWFTAGLSQPFYEQPKKALRAQNRAQASAEDAARRNEALADRAFNKANKKKPNIKGLLTQNQRSGSPGTLLTGASGADPGLLGSSTLLGS